MILRSSIRPRCLPGLRSSRTETPRSRTWMRATGPARTLRASRRGTPPSRSVDANSRALPPARRRKCNCGADCPLEGQPEGDRDNLDLIRVDCALLGVDIVDATLDVPVDHAEMQRDAGSPVDPEAHVADRRRRD